MLNLTLFLYQFYFKWQKEGSIIIFRFLRQMRAAQIYLTGRLFKTPVLHCDDITPGLGNDRPAGHMRPATHLNVARELQLKFYK